MQTTDEPQPRPASAPPEAHPGHGDAVGAGPDRHFPAHAPGPVPVSTPSATDGRSAGPPREIGGRDGPEPTRFGDWEKAGRCIDF
jgi:hypothetical protein